MSTDTDTQAAVKAAIDLALYQVMATPLAHERANAHLTGSQPGDVEAPFMSEAFLYPLLGKEDARSVLGLFRTLVAGLGYDRLTWERMLNRAAEDRTRVQLEISRQDRGKFQKQEVRDVLSPYGDAFLAQARTGRKRGDGDWYPVLSLVNLEWRDANWAQEQFEWAQEQFEAAGYNVVVSESWILDRDRAARERASGKRPITFEWSAEDLRELGHEPQPETCDEE